MSADKLTHPNKNFTDKNRAERERENFMSENLTDANSAAENSTDINSMRVNFAAENFASKNFTTGNSTSVNSATENSISANSAGKNSKSENFASENSARKNFTNENSAATQAVPDSELISVRDLVLRYGRSEILNIPSLDLNTSGITALLGSNGSGKSTLLRILAFLQRPSGGSVELWGQRAPSLQTLRQICLLLPEPVLLKRSVEQNFKFALKSRGALAEFDERVDEALGLTGLDRSFLSKKHFELSSGQTQRIAFALALAQRAKLYLLDEPTNSLDLAASKLFARAILFMRSRYGCGFIIASHDEKWLSAIAQRSVFLHRGKICEFEYKNIFDAQNGVLKFSDEISLRLEERLTRARKIAINPSKILLSQSPFERCFAGILHSISLQYGSSLLIKIKAGDVLLKCVTAQDERRWSAGEKIYFGFENGAFLGLE
ncbi:tungstate ABC transporter ATP-binding protein TupC [uncultured Campylobacter sp.]|uniref:tungstate ABC transporter ATP-binding protein TupC n=1 Tax=uncultured Campylobacter sp. TaxID=218934 RepID=UPI002609030A|nr:tungstate ABC transporter ATP-binding protein TupC [uncultured Campylobacter sp.]